MNADTDTLRVFYIEQVNRMQYHHTVIWEEIKHFSWLVSLLASGIGFVIFQQFSNYRGSTPALHLGFLFISLALCIIAIISCDNAKKIIEIEGTNFNECRTAMLKTEKVLGLHQDFEFDNEADQPCGPITAGFRDEVDHFRFDENKIVSRERIKCWQLDHSFKKAWHKTTIRMRFRRIFSLYQILVVALGLVSVVAFVSLCRT